MKKIVLVALALITLQITAQEKKQMKKERMEKMEEFSPKERAQLQTKKMTLHLDLNEGQQAQVQKLLLAQAEERKAKIAKHKAAKESGKKKKLTKDEKLARANGRLDKQIEVKKKMKSILTAEQFEKWEKISTKKRNGKRKMTKRKKERKEKKE